MNKDYIEPETSNVVGVQFSIMGPEEIRSRSVVEITKHETYEKDNPVIKGLFDSRMGSTEMGKICATCGQNNINCPGHFGHMELARPVFHWQFISYILKILKCTCLQCSKLLINKDSPQVQDLMKKSPKARWSEIYNLSLKINRCGQETDDGCGARQPDKLKLDGMDGINAIWNKLDNDSIKTQKLTIEKIKEVFERMTDEDVNILGFSDSWCRPDWLICSVFSICPPAVRPSVKQSDSQRMDDDLTHKLCDIVKCNNTLKQKILKNSRTEVIDDWTKVLQYHIATLVDNEIPGIAQAVHRSGRPLKAIRQRLKGKDGRIRNNLMGKRVDFSARSVITPDPNIDLDELGVPIKIAMNLTYPEKVNSFNKDTVFSFELLFVTIVISIPLIVSTLSKFISGKIMCSFTPKVKFPNLSQAESFSPLKSLILGNAIFTNLSRNSYILSFLKVTLRPALDPFLDLKFDIDFLNFVITGYCPVIDDMSFIQTSIFFLSKPS